MSEITTSAGVRIAYNDQGQGTPVVFIHGLGMSGSTWDQIAQKALAAGYRTLTYDQRGFGQASLPPAPYSIVDLADDLRVLLEHCNIERFHLVGHSLGGLVAQKLALAQPERILSLALICTTAHMGERAGRFAIGIAKIAELGFDTVAANATLKAQIEQILAEGFPWGPPPFAMFRRGLEKPNPAQAMAWRAMVGFSVKEQMAKFAKPTLVTHGTHDVWIPFGNGKWLGENVPRARWLPIQGAGHFPQLKQADWLASQLLDFWANCQSSAHTAK